jgi:hypothetical protein
MTSSVGNALQWSEFRGSLQVSVSSCSRNAVVEDRTKPTPGEIGMPTITHAISIRQPYVELILNGRKRYEYRSTPTNLIERVFPVRRQEESYLRSHLFSVAYHAADRWCHNRTLSFWVS